MLEIKRNAMPRTFDAQANYFVGETVLQNNVKCFKPHASFMLKSDAEKFIKNKTKYSKLALNVFSIH